MITWLDTVTTVFIISSMLIFFILHHLVADRIIDKEKRKNMEFIANCYGLSLAFVLGILAVVFFYLLNCPILSYETGIAGILMYIFLIPYLMRDKLAVVWDLVEKEDKKREE